MNCGSSGEESGGHCDRNKTCEAKRIRDEHVCIRNDERIMKDDSRMK